MNDRPLGGSSFGEEESADAGTSEAAGRLDVTPRAAEPARDASAIRTRRLVAVLGLVVLLGALGVVLFKGLSDAALFYYNVDEAIERRAELGEDRFRMQGNVVDGTIVETADGVEFVITFHDAETQVRHRGDPPELFSEKIPVIIEGSWASDGFESDEILIRHDNVYSEEHDDRLREATEDVEQTKVSEG